MKLKGMESIVSQLRAQRVDFVNQIGHIHAALIVLGKVDGTHASRLPVRTISAAAERGSLPLSRHAGQESGARVRSHPNERCQHHPAARLLLHSVRVGRSSGSRGVNQLGRHSISIPVHYV